MQPGDKSPADRLRPRTSFNRVSMGKARDRSAEGTVKFPAQFIADPDNPLEIYYREILQFPLLSADEEIKLSKNVQEGLLAKAKLSEPGLQLAPDEKTGLEKTAAAGDEAKAKFTRANLRLVASIAKRYTGNGVPLLDLIQAGNIGLGKAIDRFDPDRGFRFSTYATWWIRQAFPRIIADQGRQVRHPAYVIEKLRKLEQVGTHLVAVLGREPNPEELSAASGFTVEEVIRLRQNDRRTVSMETPVGDKGENTIGALIEDKTSPDPLEGVIARSTQEAVWKAVATLKAREQRILSLRYGLGEEAPHTLEEVGEILGITRERVRQIEAKAMTKLRHPSRARGLVDYIGY